ncbi:MAG TPA: lamin tail domain-containing protein, partial [Chthoniobacteraceae bacterium]|nr:lamin tail domain-containing protein [Chthoniobacteraceae bacterium]
PSAPAGYPTTWGTGGNQVIADYEVDPNVTGNPLYSATFESDLMAVPTMSVVMKRDDMFGPSGINSNPQSSGLAWERAASLELLYPDGSDGFQQDCGLRIQGGYGRTPAILKHSFRPLFKGDYGESKLEFPLFPDSPVKEFDTFTLRAGMNNSYVLSTGEATRATFTEDEWMRQTQRAMGQPSGYGAFFHLYINGLYWGLYNATERPSAPFMADHLGGEKSEWDALNSSEAVDGVKTAWTSLQTLCSTGANVRYITDQADWNAVMQYLDVDNLIDYMLLNFYGGNVDWDDHNWYSARRRAPGAGYKFFAWDGERTLEAGNADKTSVNQADKPSRIYAALRGSTAPATAPLNAANVEFRIRFADHIQKHLFNNGPLSPAGGLNRWNAIEALVDRAVVGESARWGDKLKEPPYTRNNEFLAEVNRKRTTQFPNRTASALTQLRNAKLYPPTSLVAPAFSQFGGKAAPGFALAITSTTPGTIYYTLNGTDPRQPWTSTTGGDGSAVDWSGTVAAGAQTYAAAVPLTGSVVVKARLRDASGLWSALTEATFQIGEAGIPLRITEVMYNPIGGDAYEFLEIQNMGATTVDLSLMTLEGVDFTFIRGTTLAAGARLALGSDLSPSLWATRYPGVTPIGYFGGKLANGGETVALKDASGNVITSFFFGANDTWPGLANGGGRSLELVDLAANPSLPTAWRASTAANGTPGVANQPLVPAPVRFNEALSRNAGAVNNGGVVAGYVELFNPGGSDVNISNWTVRGQGYLTGACRFPPDTIVPAGGYLVVWAGLVPTGFQMAFVLPEDNGYVTLHDSAGAVVDAIAYGAQIVNKSVGRVGAAWVLTQPSPGSVNVAAPVAAASQLAINEIYPHAGFIYRFIELMNRDASLPVALNGLYLQAGNAVQRIRSLSFVAPASQLALHADEIGFNLTLPV